MLTIGERLRQERVRLRLTQTALAAAGGVTKTSQLNYEQGTRFPDASYLAAVAAHGVDVQFVLTGTPAPAISSDEAEFLRRYRAASAEIRRGVFALLGAVTVTGDDSSVTINGGEQGQVIAGSTQQDNVTINVGGKKRGKPK